MGVEHFIKNHFVESHKVDWKMTGLLLHQKVPMVRGGKVRFGYGRVDKGRLG